MTHQTAEVAWRDGHVPISTRFDDPYFSLDDGAAEARYVFLDGNGLPDRFTNGFRIAELGFGTGLNFLVTYQAWMAAGAPGALSFTSFERFPMTPDQMARALAAFPDLAESAEALVRFWRSGDTTGRFADGIELTIVPGDARDSLPAWAGQADAWYLDGFSPAKNPELWEPSLMAAVGHATAAGGTAATYSAAGRVRRALQAAGFEVARRPGFGRKRHMTVASMAQ